MLLKPTIEKTLSGKILRYLLVEIDQQFRHELGTSDVEGEYYSEQLRVIAIEEYGNLDYVYS